MEILGAVASSITLAALFKYSFEAFDLIQLYKTQDVDFNHLQLRFKLEKCRLYNWGVEMGLADDSKQNLLSEWHSKTLVSETLQQIIDLFSDVQSIRKKYGCDNTVGSPSTPLLPEPENSTGITDAFNHFKVKSPIPKEERRTRFHKAKWIIRDRKKFNSLVSDVRGLVDSLEKITNDLSSSARLEEFLRIRINGVRNVDTLQAVAEVWKESHPRVASGASTRADSITMGSEFISEWQNSIDCEASDDAPIAEMEDLTITELKHSMLQSRREIKTLKELLRSSSQSIEHLEHKVRRGPPQETITIPTWAATSRPTCLSCSMSSRPSVLCIDCGKLRAHQRYDMNLKDPELGCIIL